MNTITIKYENSDFIDYLQLYTGNINLMIRADEAASLLNLSKKVFINLSNRGDIREPTTVDNKKVWERSYILQLRKETHGSG